MNIKLAGFSCDRSKMQADARPESIATAYARVSRSYGSLQVLRDEAIEKCESAEKSYKNIVHGMGHASIQEHIVFHFDLEDISRLAAEYIEHHRLCSFTERSYRYCGSAATDTNYYTSDLFPSAYFEFIQESVKAYARLKDILTSFWQENGYSDNESEIRANEDARLVLPLSQLTSIGMTVNARSLSRMIRRLRSSSIGECVVIADKLEEEVLRASPPAVRHLNPSVFERMEGEASYPIVKPLYTSLGCCRLPNEVSLESLVMQCPDLYEYGIKSYSDGVCSRNTGFDQISLNDAFPREFELIDFIFKCVGSASFYAQLKRHRISTIIASPYNPIFGCTVRSYFTNEANSIVRDMFLKSNELAYSMADFVSSPEYRPYSPAPYLLLNAHRRHVLVKMNFRELIHFFKLRCSPHAQEEIRSFSIALKDGVFYELSRAGLNLGRLEKLLKEFDVLVSRNSAS